MLNAYLRKSGGSLIMTIPASYAEQNGLDAGSCVSVDINGIELKVFNPVGSHNSGLIGEDTWRWQQFASALPKNKQ